MKANALLDRPEAIARDELHRTELSLLGATRDSRLGFQSEQDYVHTPYSLRRDEIQNVAARPEFATIKEKLSAMVDRWMKETSDPRVDPAYDEFDKYPYFGGGSAPELRRWESDK